MSDVTLPPAMGQVTVEVEMNLQPPDHNATAENGVSEHRQRVTVESAGTVVQSLSEPDDKIEIVELTPLPQTSQAAGLNNNLDQIFSSTTGNLSSISDGVCVTLSLAATLLGDAKSNRFIDFKPDPRSHRLYNWYYKPIFKWIQYMGILIVLALAALEKPSIWPDAVPFWACSLIELTVLGYLAFRVIHLASFQHKTAFWSDKKNVMAIILITLSVVDIVCYSIWESVGPNSHPVRWSRPLRPLFVINFPHARQIRRAFRNIRRTVTEIVFVLILFFFSVMLFALLARKLLSRQTELRTKHGEPYFNNYGEALWSLYVLVTTANNPDVMMPAYDSSNWYALFFIVFLVVNLYIFMNVLLAVIFNSYKGHLKNEVKEAVFAKRRKLASAYDLVKEKNSDGVGYHLTLDTWAKLMKILKPQNSEQQVKMLFQVMDGDGDGKLSKAEFLTSADLLNVPLTEVKDRMLLWDKLFPRVFNCAASKAVRLVVLHRFFRYFFDFAIVVNAVFIATELEEAEWFFMALFTLEILLKFYAYGPHNFAAQFWNMFDVVVIGGALIATVVEASRGESDLEGVTLDYILVLRVLRLVKIVHGFDRFRIVIRTLINIGPSIIIYGGVLLIFYYTFAVIGMEIFGGKIHYYGDNTYKPEALPTVPPFCGNQLLNGSEFWMDRYCSNNFNDIAKAMVVLTELTVVNQWHVLTKGFELVTHPAARIYFLIFHLSVVVLIMNIFIAFILEAFILEYSLSKSKFESHFEAKILQLGYALGQKKLEVPDNKARDRDFIVDEMEVDARPEEGTRFHVRQTRRKVEVLLQRMFEDELDPDDLGDDLDDDRPPRKFTFDTFVN